MKLDKKELAINAAVSFMTGVIATTIYLIIFS